MHSVTDKRNGPFRCFQTVLTSKTGDGKPENILKMSDYLSPRSRIIHACKWFVTIPSQPDRYCLL